MASADMKKMTKQQVSNQIAKHCYRTHLNFSNQHINLDMSYKNKYYGYESWNLTDPRTQRDEFRRMRLTEMERYKARIAEIDAQAEADTGQKLHIRNDRVTGVSIYIPAPREGMTEEEQAAWADRSVQVLKDLYGEENVFCCTYHADEVHEYQDKGELHTSRGHLHATVIPVLEFEKEQSVRDENGRKVVLREEPVLDKDGNVELKKNGQPRVHRVYQTETVRQTSINGREWLDKDRYAEVNRALDAACQEMFHIPFQDGSMRKSRGTVEDLKAREVVENIQLNEKAKLEMKKARQYTEYLQSGTLLDGEKYLVDKQGQRIPPVKELMSQIQDLQGEVSDLQEKKEEAALLEVKVSKGRAELTALEAQIAAKKEQEQIDADKAEEALKQANKELEHVRNLVIGETVKRDMLVDEMTSMMTRGYNGELSSTLRDFLQGKAREMITETYLDNITNEASRTYAGQAINTVMETYSRFLCNEGVLKDDQEAVHYMQLFKNDPENLADYITLLESPGVIVESRYDKLLNKLSKSLKTPFEEINHEEQQEAEHTRHRGHGR